MAHRLDVLIRSRQLTNEKVAELVECSPNYISGIRNGIRPGLKLATALCHLFAGELTLHDLGIEIEAQIAPSSSKSDEAA